MATRSKPVRIFADDDSALAQLAQLMRRSRAEVVHEALAEYLANHREELGRLYEETQSALASGDLERLIRASAPARRAEVDAIMADIPAQRLETRPGISSASEGHTEPKHMK